jgi:hypothetical protein
LFHDLSRSAGAGIVDWVKMLEWHKDGYPHWHIMVLVDKPGRAGMIGGGTLRRYWQYGNIQEGYIKDGGHWKRFNGYFGAKGYFEDKKGKAHQVTLPDWARERTTPIRRMSRKVRAKDMEYIKPTQLPYEALSPEEKGKRKDENLVELGNWFEKMGDIHKNRLVTEGQKLDACGELVEIFAGCGWEDFVITLEIPYKEFCANVKGVFIPGQGFVFNVRDNPEFFPTSITIG